MPKRSACSVVLPLLLIALALQSCDLIGDNERMRLLDSVSGKVVLSSPVDGEHQLHTMNLGGRDSTQLTGLDGGAFEPSWSPDGTSIAFVTFENSTTLGPSIYLIAADGSNLRPLKRFTTESPSVLPGHRPVWSPSGERIAFDACFNCAKGGKNYDNMTVTVEGDTLDPADIQRLTDNRAEDTNPTWSPDGEQIAFVSNRDYADAESGRLRTDLYLVKADGSGLRRLTDTRDVSSPRWSPDGESIIYGSSGPGAALFLLSTTTGISSRVETGFPDQWKLFPVAWSADGNVVLISAVEYPEHSLYLLDIESGRTEALSMRSERLLGADAYLQSSSD